MRICAQNLKAKFLPLLGLFVLCAMAGHAAPQAKLLPKNGMLEITVRHNANEDFLQEIEDALRAGHLVHLKHSIHLSTFGLWSRELAEANKSKYVRFNPLQQVYSVGEAPNSLREVQNRDEMYAYILGVKGLPLIQKNRLRTAEEYELYIELVANDVSSKNGDWLDYVSLSRWWEHNKLVIKEIYIAR